MAFGFSGIILWQHLTDSFTSILVLLRLIKGYYLGNYSAFIRHDNNKIIALVKMFHVKQS